MGKFFKVIESDWTHDFRVINFQDSSEFGVCYEETKQVWITLHRHESIQNIIDTIIHESLHQAITSNSQDDDMDESIKMHGEQEHELMKRVIWAMNDWIF